MKVAIEWFKYLEVPFDGDITVKDIIDIQEDARKDLLSVIEQCEKALRSIVGDRTKAHFRGNGPGAIAGEFDVKDLHMALDALAAIKQMKEGK